MFGCCRKVEWTSKGFVCKERDEGGSLWEGERCIVLHSFELPSRAVKSSVLQAGTVETLHCIATCHWAVYCSLLQRSLSVCKHRLFVEETEWGPQLLQYSANKQTAITRNTILFCNTQLQELQKGVLDALASLVLIIKTHSLKIDSPWDSSDTRVSVLFICPTS